MSTNVLIVTEAGDLHAYAVAEALRRKGATPLLWHTSDFPHRATETVLFEEGRRVAVRDSAQSLVGHHIDSVWFRRPAQVVDPEALHPADRPFAEMGCRELREGVFRAIAPDAFWVNPRENALRSTHKIAQHLAAMNVGLTMPDTLYTNDPDEIRAFIRRHGGSIVFKPLKTLPWRDDQAYYMPYTALLTEDQLVEDALLKAAPGIYQALVPKAFELRVTIMGTRVFAAKIDSQSTRGGRIDWRKSYGEMQMTPFELPHEVASLCIALLRELGLVFGCVDLIATPDGRFVFLEVNQMGQFSFVEQFTGMPLIDAFAEFLLQRRIDFDWHEERTSVRHSELDWEELASHGARHVAAPNLNWHETAM